MYSAHLGAAGRAVGALPGAPPAPPPPLSLLARSQRPSAQSCVQRDIGRLKRRALARARQDGRAAAPSATIGAASDSDGEAPAGTTLEQAVEALQTRLRAAVLAEQSEQARVQAASYGRTSAARLAASGQALLGLQAAPRGRMFADFVWSFSRSGSGPLPYHRFKRGDTVLLAPASGAAARSAGRRPGGPGGGSDGGSSDRPAVTTEDGEQLEGTVLEAGGQQLQVAVGKAVADALGAVPAGTLWRLDQGTSAVTTRRQLAALQRLPHLSDPSNRGETAVRAVLLGSPASERLARQPSEWARSAEWRGAAGAALEALPGLNASQRRAVAVALTRSFTLWQGPPGTGKTRTLLAFIETLVRAADASAQRRRSQGAVLAVADTNAAADNLLEGLLARGIRAVRVGQPAKVRPELRGACLEALVERSAPGQRAAKLRAGADTLMHQVRALQQRLAAAEGAVQAAAAAAKGTQAAAQRPGQQAAHRPAGQQLQQQTAQQQAAQQQLRQYRDLGDQVRALQRQADSLWKSAEQTVADEALTTLRRAPVVVATCNGAGDARLEGQNFRIVVLDEASQATEASSLVPLVKGAECVVMAGDQRQLPPTVLSRRALELGLDVPLFNRLADAGVRSSLLDVQYRMHPAIAAFPSLRFYGGKVLSGVTEVQRPPVQGVPWSNPSCPVLFINVEGEEQRTSGGDGQRGSRGSDGGSSSSSRSGGGRGGSESAASYSNRAEAEIAVKVLRRLLEQDPELRSVALLSPYSGQVRLLSELLAGADLPAGGSSSDTEDPAGAGAGASPAVQLAVSTVDGYQGREADCVIFSAVRCNRQGRVGFLSDERRLNVAITRPRRGLIVVGHQATLAHDPTWAAWMSWVAAQRKRRGEVQGAAVNEEAAAAAAAEVAAEAQAPAMASAASGRARAE